MSLQVSKLEKTRELAGGVVQARCPACAEGGHDKAGEHLRVYPDGRFGCCVYPKDREHRKRIYALAGDKAPRTFSVRVAKGKADQRQSVRGVLENFLGTPGTGVGEGVNEYGLSISLGDSHSGTLGTGSLMSRAHARGEDVHHATHAHMYKDNEPPVPNVPRCLRTAAMQVATGERLPYFTPAGTLVIPFDSPERFHWWKGGQSVSAIRAELLGQGHQAEMENEREFHGTEF
jgi:hypothetical protein